MIKQISQHSRNHRKRAGTTHAREKVANNKRLRVLGDGRAQGEDRAGEHGEREGPLAAAELGQGRPEDGAEGEAEDVEGCAEGGGCGGEVEVGAGGGDGGRKDGAGEGDDEGAAADEDGGEESVLARKVLVCVRTGSGDAGFAMRVCLVDERT